MIGQDFLPLQDGSRVAYAIRFPTRPVMHIGPRGPTNDVELTAADTHSSDKILRHRVYPWSTFPRHPARDEQLFTFQNIAGSSGLPPLHKNASDSMQETLEVYVSKTVKKTCAVDVFEQQGLVITTEAATTDVVFNPTNTVIKLNWPIEIEDPAGGVGRIEEVLITLPVGMATVHAQLAAEETPSLLLHDAVDISYDARQFAAVKDVSTKDNPFGSIVTYTTPAYMLRQAPYTFRFARYNRPPALFAIDQTKLDAIRLCDGQTPRIDIDENVLSIPSPTGEQRIALTAMDPDEQELRFTLIPLNQCAEDDPVACYRVRVRDTAGEIDFQDIALFRGACP